MNRHVEDAKRIFSQYSPLIRDYIYRNGWDELRTVQILAGRALFEDNCHLILSSPTASGKTEATLFPLLSMMEKEGPENFLVIYLSPLKSLINDQYSRMDAILEHSAMPVTRWHGDVSARQKTQFLKAPAGLLQITPESLESMLCRRGNDIPRIFRNLKFVVIDEIHSLMGSDRGNQILCQLERLERLISNEPRRIALSATIGSLTEAKDWLRGNSQRPVKSVNVTEQDSKWRLRIEHFYTTNADADGFDPSYHYVYNVTKGAKCVVFSNSREETEEVCSSLRQIAKKKNEPDRFYIHHGNLSAAIREETEKTLKSDDKAITAAATVTLELGVDIGRLKRIVNISAPTSVSGFLQRLGRSGRRGEPPEMAMVFREEEALPNAPLCDILPWELIQGIAIVELYRKEKWIEPPRSKPFPASLLFHQTLSTLASCGALPPKELARRVLTLSPFQNFQKEDYKEFLIHLIKTKILSLTENKELLIGERGEKILNSFRFFAVFQDSEDFTVRCGSEEIGTITASPPIGERFALAGRVWEVEEIDVKRRLVFAKAVEGKMKISWPGNQGDIHTRILEKMREIITGSEEYPYLSAEAAKRLRAARDVAKRAGMDQHDMISLGGDHYVYFPWLGTRPFAAMKRLLQKKLASRAGLFDVDSRGTYYITFRCADAPVQRIQTAFRQFSENEALTPLCLVLSTEYPVSDKYDPYLPHSMLLDAYANNRLSTFEIKDKIQSMK